nr:double Clp-N motif-containing P-loop nucleoside triphosphate hydrolases superfamily protein [Tanacetum cinerariifolium]
LFGCGHGLKHSNTAKASHLKGYALKNKINPQHSQASSGRKFLEGRRPPKNGKVLDDENEKEISKWVKTDSEPSRGGIWFGFVRPDMAAKKKTVIALAKV